MSNEEVKKPATVWTTEQEQAINVKNGATIVSAAAGSGKTAVLVERVKKILLDVAEPTDADRLVVVTYTNKAAAELIARIDMALTKAKEENEGNEAVCNHIEKQLLLLSEASISTISSFCLNIIRKNSAAIGIAPNFSTLEEAASEMMIKNAASQIIEEFCESGDKDEKELIYGWFCEETDEELEKTLIYMYSFYRGLLDPEEYFDYWISVYEGKEPYPDTALKSYISAIECNYDRMASSFRESGDAKRIKHLEKWKPLIDALAKPLDDENKELILGMKLPTAIAKDAESKKYKDIIKSYFDSLTDYIRLDTVSEDSRKVCAPVLKILVRLVKQLDERYSDFKREKNKLDFSDMENIVLKMLRDKDGNKTDFAKELSEYYSYIIVDEFQDSNDIQYEIFRLISKDKDNLYFVGDIKQSIYRFRGANPLIFSSVMNDGDFNVINLNRNFRSSEPVITAVNEIFSKTMTTYLGDVDYDERHMLVQGREYEVTEENCTEMVVFEGESSDIKKTEAEYIAKRINSMVGEGFPVTEKDGTKRPCRYGDFAILMAKYSKDANIYTGALDKEKIPYEAKDDRTYTSFLEVKLAMSLLKVINNPYSNTDMATVLISVPYLFSADEMAVIKQKGSGKHKHIYTGLLEKKNDPKIKRFLDDLTELREFAKENTVEALIRHIYDESALIPAVRAMPQGRKRDANLKMLINYAVSFAELTGGELYDFIEYMEGIEKNGIRLLNREGGGVSADNVSIMTIHGSKGLEFPICFVANMPTMNKKSPFGPNLIACDKDMGVGMMCYDKALGLRHDTLMLRTVKENETRMEMSESLRLLYVAATRAKEKLIFTATQYPRSGKGMHYEWVLGTAEDENSSILLVNDPELSGDEAGESEEEIREIELSIGGSYKYEKYTVIPAKVTATEIGVKGEEAFSEYNSRLGQFLRSPSFVSDKAASKLTGKKKGDAYHKAMELLDFSKPVSQLDELYASGSLTEAERISIDDNEIEKFLGSNLCRRAVKSGNINKEYPIFCECPAGYFGLSEEDERPFIQGIADMFFIEDGEIVLVDYKTNANTTPEKLREEYEGQLRIYRNALEEITGMKVKESLLYSFSLGCTVAVD